MHIKKGVVTQRRFSMVLNQRFGAVYSSPLITQQA